MLPVKKMLFLPRKIATYHNKLYLAFNLSAVPPDMRILAMHLYLPHVSGTSLYVKRIRKIEETWHPKSVKKGKIPRCSSPLKLPYKQNQNCLAVNVTGFHQLWRRKNNGLCLEYRPLPHFRSKPLPYLILAVD